MYVLRCVHYVCRIVYDEISTQLYVHIVCRTNRPHTARVCSPLVEGGSEAGICKKIICTKLHKHRVGAAVVCVGVSVGATIGRNERCLSGRSVPKLQVVVNASGAVLELNSHPSIACHNETVIYTYTQVGDIKPNHTLCSHCDRPLAVVAEVVVDGIVWRMDFPLADAYNRRGAAGEARHVVGCNN